MRDVSWKCQGSVREVARKWPRRRRNNAGLGTSSSLYCAQRRAGPGGEPTSPKVAVTAGMGEVEPMADEALFAPVPEELGACQAALVDTRAAPQAAAAGRADRDCGEHDGPRGDVHLRGAPADGAVAGPGRDRGGALRRA